MAVGKIKAATTVMLGAGPILPYAAVWLHFYGEGPIVDAVWMLVDQHPQVYRRWECHVRNLYVMSVHARVVILQVALILHAESLAHGKGPHPRDLDRAKGPFALVRNTFVNGWILHIRP